MPDNCFIDYVGLRLCNNSKQLPNSDTPTPADTPTASGLYINTLPGISIRMLDGIADQDEQINFRAVWNDIQQEAQIVFEVDFFNELSNCYATLNAYCDYTALMCKEVNKKKLVNAWRYLLGSLLMTYRTSTDRLNIFTLDDTQANKLQAFYTVEYQAALKKAVNSIDTSDCCLPCGGKNIRQVTWLP